MIGARALRAALDPSRAAVLDRVRHAIGRPEGKEAAARDAVADWIAASSANPRPRRGWLPATRRLQLFCSMVERVHGQAIRLAVAAEVPKAIADTLRHHDLPLQVVRARNPMVDDLPWASEPRLQLRIGSPVDADPVGLTVAVAGVAETGTLLLASGKGTPQLLAFLPETSFIVVSAAAIVPDYESAWAMLPAGGGQLPRAVNLVTGPSRTGDIEQRLELGAHGPRRLVVLVVGEAEG